jgi:hypothetical protein
MNAADLIEFEKKIAALWAAGELPFLTHLAGGNEAQLINIFNDIGPDDWVFASHRCHYHALLKVDTTTEERRGGPVLGLEEIFGCVIRYRYTPTYPHAGDGINLDPSYNPEIVARHSNG